VIANDKKLARALPIMKQSNATNQLAAERIIELVKSLRTFSRDAGEPEEIDLHRSIDATLTAARRA